MREQSCSVPCYTTKVARRYQGAPRWGWGMQAVGATTTATQEAAQRGSGTQVAGAATGPIQELTQHSRCLHFSILPVEAFSPLPK